MIDSNPAIKTGDAPTVTAITENNTTKEVDMPTGKTPSHPDYLRLILTSRVYDILKETPLTTATNLSEKVGATVLLKREDLQPVFSFKIRGAYNKMAHLTEEERWRGVVAVSAGNHAQGVAYSAQHLGIPATVVMPAGTPSIKHSNVSRLGSKVVLIGQNFDEAKLEGARLAQKHNLVNIPPYDDPYVIAGQGTIAMEILRQTNVSNLKAIFVCVGGGGLIAGIAAYVKRIVPHVKIIGVETHDADAMKRSLAADKHITLKDVGLFADGTAVKVVGEETFRLCRDLVDEIVLVSTDELCAAIKDVFEDTRGIVEPSGALGVAGLKKYLKQNPPSNPNDTYCATLSGANMNFDRLRFVAERAELGLAKEVFFSVTIPERPGSFIKLHNIITPRAVTEFSYRYSDPSKAHIYLSFKVVDRQVEVPEILKKLRAEGFDGEDNSDNEMAKSHARYLVGGKSSAENERLYRFEFPEQHGALGKFLSELPIGLNISLFHYRNHGADVASVLIGIQIPATQSASFQTFLQGLDYPYVDETSNSVYTKFMKGTVS
ncbi:Threonine dehydratase [Taphrina deformans PYCC 5710]|uniref:Threonine dehydratase n=1 Tax=Taphrina deformans (strain PYCC 5710 / ATCC 11124 / CBS 356.35 / IMI 108563 / JCM 9778 / NBRC 8474) TaxID=1097556 RepID=R4X9D7_TAPDE|nr:Threonine dehydratase [Taphrina deformans PYCC 5710]|eukprot:CCG82035.1 Threonine dehydratase [Taphrina deformans PYCC 5710]